MSNLRCFIVAALIAFTALSVRADGFLASPATPSQVAAGTDKSHFVTPFSLANSGVIPGTSTNDGYFISASNNGAIYQVTSNTIYSSNSTGTFLYSNGNLTVSGTVTFGTTNASASTTNLTFAYPLGASGTFNGTLLSGTTNTGGVNAFDVLTRMSTGTGKGAWSQTSTTNSLFGVGTWPGQAMAVSNSSAGSLTTVLLKGIVRNDSWNWTYGHLLYASTNPGAMTQTPEQTTNVQVLGYALSSNTIVFDPSPLMTNSANAGGGSSTMLLYDSEYNPQIPSPAAATTYYFGGDDAVVLSTVEQNHQFRFGVACTVKTYEVDMKYGVSGNSSSSDYFTNSINLNGVQQVSTILPVSPSDTSIWYTNGVKGGFSVSIPSNTLFSVRCDSPSTWGTTPQNVRFRVRLYGTIP